MRMSAASSETTDDTERRFNRANRSGEALLPFQAGATLRRFRVLVARAPVSTGFVELCAALICYVEVESEGKDRVTQGVNADGLAGGDGFNLGEDFWMHTERAKNIGLPLATRNSKAIRI